MSKEVELICAKLRELHKKQTPLAHDIEGWATTGVSVCSFAWSPHEAISIPLARLDWRRWWSVEDEQEILAAVKGILEDPAIPKVFHNGCYELFVWAWHYGIRGQGVADDTMIKHAVLWPELDKSLDVCASIYTREPYWKHLGDTEDDLTLARYNALDSMLTFEINEAMEPMLSSTQRDYYTAQVALLEPVLDMMMRGFAYDCDQRDLLVAQLEREVLVMTGELDQLAGIAPPTFEQVAQAVAFKPKLDRCRTWQDIVTHAKPRYRQAL